MSQCPQCGTPTQPGQSFCGACGTRLSAPPSEQTVILPATPPTPPAESEQPSPAEAEQPTVQFPAVPPQLADTPPQQGWQQPPPPQYGARRASRSSVDLSWLTRGNWIGAVATAGAAFGVALVLGAIVAFTTAQDLDVTSAFGMTALLTGAAFGADLVQKDGNDFIAYGQFPLLITLLAFLAAAVVFRRTTAGYPSWKAALGDAGRAALILTGLLTVLAIVVKLIEPDLAGYDSADTNQGLEDVDSFAELLARSMARGGLATGISGGTTTSIPGAIFLGLILLFVVLAIASFVRRDWLDARTAKVHDWLVAPLAGFGALLLGLTAAGLVYVIAILVGEQHARSFHNVVGMIAVLPALGMRLLGLGSFAEFGATVRSDARDDDFRQRVGDFADDNGGLFWIAPVVMLALAAFSVWYVIHRTSDRARVRRNVAVYVGLILVVLPLLIRFANLHMSGESGNDDFSLFGGVDGFQTTMLFFLFSVLAAFVMLVVTGNLDLAELRSKVSSFAQSVQQQSGQRQPRQQPGQPGQQPWGQPPPPPPGWGQQPPPPPPGWGQQPPPPPPGWGKQPPPPPQWAPPRPPQGPPPQGPPPQGPPPQGRPPQGPPPQGRPPQGPPPQGPPPQGPPPQH